MSMRSRYPAWFTVLFIGALAAVGCTTKVIVVAPSQTATAPPFATAGTMERPSQLSTPTPTAPVPPKIVESTPTRAAQATFDDPFAYCAAVGTIDAPDSRYIGVEYPRSVLDGLAAAMGGRRVADVVPWRCVAGQVWGCNVGANLPCGRIDTSKVPTQPMNDYCRDNPGATFLPAFVTGHSTEYEWQCNGAIATAGMPVIALDPRGFGADFWFHLAPPQ